MATTMRATAGFLGAFLLACGLAAEPIVQIPFELTGDLAFVEVQLAGQALSFAFDTGAGGVGIHQATAQRLGLEATGTGPVTGAAGTLQVPLLEDLTLRLGDLQLKQITAAVVALGHLEEAVGRPVDGIIGQDVLRGRLVLLDHDRQVLEVHPRRGFPFAEWGGPCTLKHISPLSVDGEVRLLDGESLSGRFHIDSGAAAFLVLNSVFVRQHSLANRVGATYARKGRALTAVTTEDAIGRVAGITFCGHEFPKSQTTAVPAVLSGASAGVLARRGEAGLIGNAVLRRFNLVFDLDRERLYLRPNGHWDDAIKSDASGLFLARRGDGTIVVDDVVAASPAAEAGLQPGDELRSINGISLRTMTLAQLRDHLKEPDRTLRLLVTRAGEANRVPLHTRDLFGPGNAVESSPR